MLTKAAAVLTLAAAVLLAACGGGGEDEEEAGGNEQVGVEEFGMTDEELVTSIEKGESLIAACMREEGFEYVPNDAVTFRAAMDALTSVPGLSDEEFVEQYGYGLSTLPPAQSFGAGEQNKRIQENLSPADQVAYERALWGDNTEATFVVMLENEDFGEAGGCTKTAIEQVFTEEQLSPSFENPFDARVAQDQRMIDALQKWSDCMSEDGYDFESPEDAEDEIIERLEAVLDGADPATLTGSAKESLAELQADERAIAKADLDCSEEFLFDVEEEVERDLSGRN